MGGEVGDGAEVTRVRAFTRGLAVIEAFGHTDRPEMTLSEVARATDLPRAVVRRLLHTLVDLGYVTALERTYRPTPRLVGLGHAYLSSAPLPDLAHPHLRRAAAETAGVASLAVLDGDRALVVAQSAPPTIVFAHTLVGGVRPATATAMGRALLAGLDDDALWGVVDTADRPPLTAGTVTDADEVVRRIRRVRLLGYAFVDGESRPGIRCLAVPVATTDGEVIGAVVVATDDTTVEDQLLDRLLPPVREAARGIAATSSRTDSRSGG